MNLSDGLADGLDKQVLSGNERLAYRNQSRKSQRIRRDDLRGIHFGFWVWPGRWAVRIPDKRFENRGWGLEATRTRAGNIATRAWTGT